MPEARANSLSPLLPAYCLCSRLKAKINMNFINEANKTGQGLLRKSEYFGVEVLSTLDEKFFITLFQEGD